MNNKKINMLMGYINIVSHKKGNEDGFTIDNDMCVSLTGEPFSTLTEVDKEKLNYKLSKKNLTFIEGGDSITIKRGSTFVYDPWEIYKEQSKDYDVFNIKVENYKSEDNKYIRKDTTIFIIDGNEDKITKKFTEVVDIVENKYIEELDLEKVKWVKIDETYINPRTCVYSHKCLLK